MPNAIFLDRDGVINEPIVRHGKPFSPNSLDELFIIDGVISAIQSFRDAGFEIVVITNQPDVARQKISVSKIDEIHQYLTKFIGACHFYMCPHDDEDNCDCRKPKPGLITKAVSDLNIDVGKSFLVGDRWKDIEAGQKAGCKSFYIDRDYQEKKPKKPYTRVKTLEEASWIILNQAR